MGLMKIALIIGGVVIGVGAVGGITAGVVSSSQSSDETINSSSNSNKKEPKKDSNPNKDDKEKLPAYDSSVVDMNATIMMNFQKELDKITEANLVVESIKNKEVH